VVRSTTSACESTSDTDCCSGNYARAIAIDSTVVSIAAKMFNGCAAVQLLNLNDASALETIGTDAFKGTQITTLDFSKAAQRLHTIGQNAFPALLESRVFWRGLDCALMHASVSPFGSEATFACKEADAQVCSSGNTGLYNGRHSSLLLLFP